VSKSERALELAREAGFDLAGVAPLRAPRDAERLREWLAAGRHAGLDWIARDVERIADPTLAWPTGRSLLIVGLAHSRPPVELEGGGRIARYAAGRDYHNVMGRMLRKLRRALIKEGLATEGGLARAGVDALPLLERSHAAEAGLGFASKAANLLHPSFGPWFFVGELILDVELDPTPTPPAGSCGTCRACIDACPTEAIVAPGVVDARRCISYHTIESTQPAPRELRAGFGAWAFGCDVCSQVCPWASKAPDLAERWGVHRAVEQGSLTDWLRLRDEAQVSERFEGSPLQRPRRAGLARNAALALGAIAEHRADRELLDALAFDDDASVRDAAAWSLARTRGADPLVRSALEAAQARETDAAAREQMRLNLDGAP
jgi:epoxyqueuosine reductase